MIKRRFFKQEHVDKNGDSDSSSSSSDSEAEAQEEDEEETAEEVEAVADVKEDQEPDFPEPGSGYESEESSANEVDVDSSGLLVNDDEEGSEHCRQSLSESRSSAEGNVVTVDTQSNGITKKDSTKDDSDYYILKCKSVFKCRLCPRIVCLTEDSLRAHLKSKSESASQVLWSRASSEHMFGCKGDVGFDIEVDLRRHTRSEKLLREGRLKFMLNSDGEIEEEQETHAERHARTVALAEDLANPKRKNKGRQRQRRRLRKKKTADGSNNGKEKQSMKNPAKKRRMNED